MAYIMGQLSGSSTRENRSGSEQWASHLGTEDYRRYYRLPDISKRDLALRNGKRFR